MPSAEEYDRKIDEMEKKLALMKERRRNQAAKERERQRKWREAVAAAIGEAVIDAAGCDWSELDLESLRGILDGDLLAGAVIEGRTPADAKKALDDAKKARRTAKQDDNDGADGNDPEPEVEMEQPVGEPRAAEALPMTYWPGV